MKELLTEGWEPVEKVEVDVVDVEAFIEDREDALLLEFAVKVLEDLAPVVGLVMELREFVGIGGFVDRELGVEVGGLAAEVAAAFVRLVRGVSFLNLAVVGGGRADVARKETFDGGFDRGFCGFGWHLFWEN